MRSEVAVGGASTHRMRTMSDTGYERATEAFRRLLAEAGLGGQARVDAIVALSQRTVFVATWAPLHEGFRTLVNAARAEALPIFSDLDQLVHAATQFGWLGQDGQVAHREIGAREAFQTAVDRDMPFIVLDVAAEHALEIQREEIEPLLGPFGRRDSTGPFAAVGRISSTLLEAASRATPEPSLRPSVAGAPAPDRRSSVPTPIVRPSSFPAPTTRRPTPPSSSFARPSATAQAPDPKRPSSSDGIRPGALHSQTVAPATAASDAGVRLTPVMREPDEALVDRLHAELKDYPEVEWASYCLAAYGDAAYVPTIGVRIDPAYRQRVDRIAQLVRAAGAEHGTALSLLLLDDPGLLREARNEGILFYPWKRRTRPP